MLELIEGATLVFPDSWHGRELFTKMIRAGLLVEIAPSSEGVSWPTWGYEQEDGTIHATLVKLEDDQ